MPSDSDQLHSPAVSHRLFADQVNKQYEHTGFGTAATLINGMILAFVLRGHVESINLLIWLTVAVLVSVSRLVVHRSYRKSPTKKSNPQTWNAWFLATLCLSGMLWGSAAIFLFPSDSIGHQAFIAFVTGGMVAGAIGAFSAVLPAFLPFQHAGAAAFMLPVFHARQRHSYRHGVYDSSFPGDQYPDGQQNA